MLRNIKFDIHRSVVIPILNLRRWNLMYNSSIIIATYMSYNYFPCVKRWSINNIQKYLPIFRATLITVCCLCSYMCTVVLEAGNRVWIRWQKYLPSEGITLRVNPIIGNQTIDINCSCNQLTTWNFPLKTCRLL